MQGEQKWATWWRKRGGTTRWEMKEIYGEKGRIERGGDGKGGLGEGRMGERGKVVVLSGGCAFSEVAVWNHPGPCNS